MNEFIQDTNGKGGHKLGWSEIYLFVCYAYDAVSIADNGVDLERLLCRFSVSCQKF
jgi:hypothetical protein